MPTLSAIFASTRSAIGRWFGLRSRGESAPNRQLNASYDAARSGPLDAHWQYADHLDADSAHSPEIRKTLVSRSRYESESNGMYAGMHQTHATAVVGTGPILRMQTGNAGFNQQIEREWYEWVKATQLRRKLWSAALAWKKDGETLGILQNNPVLQNPVKLDVSFLETDHLQSPDLPYGIVGRLDGVHLDRFGNVMGYDVLPIHPGSNQQYQQRDPEFIPARNALHLFSLHRPGQHRGVPACSSTLNVGARSRRFREAVVRHAEIAANHTSVLYSEMPTNTEEVPVDLQAFTSLPITPGTQTVLPRHWRQDSFKSDQPRTGYGEFIKSQTAESARPLGMPHSIAACDASDANFSSLKTNHLTYYAQVAVDRADVTELVLDPLFREWWIERQLSRGVPLSEVLGRPVPAHEFVWPVQPSADRNADAQAEDTKLRNGTLTFSRACSDAGLDSEDEIAQAAADYGITPDEFRRVLLFTFFPAAGQALAKPEPAADPAAPPGDDTELEDADALDTTIA